MPIRTPTAMLLLLALALALYGGCMQPAPPVPPATLIEWFKQTHAENNTVFPHPVDRDTIQAEGDDTITFVLVRKGERITYRQRFEKTDSGTWKPMGKEEEVSVKKIPTD